MVETLNSESRRNITTAYERTAAWTTILFIYLFNFLCVWGGGLKYILLGLFFSLYSILMFLIV